MINFCRNHFLRDVLLERPRAFLSVSERFCVCWYGLCVLCALYEAVCGCVVRCRLCELWFVRVVCVVMGWCRLCELYVCVCYRVCLLQSVVL